MRGEEILALEGVGREAGGATLLAGLGFRIEAGERVALLGASGSGKSTLLRLLPRLDDPDRGTIRFAGRPLEAYDPLELRRSVRLVFQTAVALPGSAGENLEAAASLAGRDLGPADQRRLLENVGLEPERLERSADRLSGGERQRLSLARALVSEPRLLALDEPTAHLDLPAARTFLEAAKEVETIVVATHDLEAARGFAQRVLVLEAGRLVEDSPAEAFFDRPGSEAGRRLMEWEP
jgi:ABC-type multidrug transport system ATPase subunit